MYCIDTKILSCHTIFTIPYAPYKNIKKIKYKLCNFNQKSLVINYGLIHINY